VSVQEAAPGPARPVALDLFCSAGGASMGLHRAGFTVVGVDHAPQPNYPFHFIQADALEYPLDGFDFVWASPPCQAYCSMKSLAPHKVHPVLVEPVRDRLLATDVPWVIENVVGAPLRGDVMLCGSMFGLGVRRHRIFELSTDTPLMTLSCNHGRPITGVYGSPHGKNGAWPGMKPSSHAVWAEAMGIDWMTTRELTQAIPPAYSEWIVSQLKPLVFPHLEART